MRLKIQDGMIVEDCDSSVKIMIHLVSVKKDMLRYVQDAGVVRGM